MSRRSTPAATPALLLALALAVGLGLGLAPVPAPGAAFEPREFPSAEAEARYKHLVSELRCLVCQNQNLADSNADLAGDMRREVHDMILAGKSDAEIIDFMVARFGDFVLYRPPLKPKTVLLWAAPALLAAGGLLFLYRQLRRRQATAPSADLSDTDRARLRALLDQEAGDE